MKSIIFFVLSMSFAAVSGAQTTDWKRLDLKGKVKSLKTQETYRYKPSGVWTEWAKTYGRTYLFNNTGYNTEFKEFIADGSMSYKIMYTYNLKEKKTELSYFDKDSKPTTKTVYILNDKGQKTEELLYTKEGKLNWRYTYAYDDKGNNINRTGYKTDGTLSSTYTWIYDSKGNPTDLKVETPGYATSSKKYAYDDKGNMKEEIWYNGQGGIDFRFIRAYDANGNKTEELKYKGQDKLLDKVTWRYEYDKPGNWTKRTQATSDGIDFHIEERTIIYY